MTYLHRRQISWLSAVFDAFVHGKPQKLAFQHSAFPETGDFQPLKVSLGREAV